MTYRCEILNATFHDKLFCHTGYFHENNDVIYVITIKCHYVKVWCTDLKEYWSE